MLSIIIFAILFIVAIFLLIRAIINYQREKEQIEFMNNYMKRYQANQEYWKLYNQCKKQQEELDE